MKKNVDLVSIIMPAYNCEEFISESIKSISQQSYVNWELIIIDDCSNDRTFKICNNFAKNDSRIFIHKNSSRKGAAFSRNYATKLSSGKYIAFLDSDDIWKFNKLEKQLAFMKENDFDFTYTFYEIFKSNNKKISLIKCPKKIHKLNMLFSNPIGCLTVIYNKERLGKISSPLFKKRNDYSLWLEILSISMKGHCLDESLALYRKSNNGLSSGKFQNVLYYWKIIRNYYNFWYLLILISTPIYFFILILKKNIPILYNKLIRLF